MTVHRYYITPTGAPDYDSWSVWLLDEPTQTLIVFGDYGTWDYTWYGKGDFRKKLLGFDTSYLENKLSVGEPTELDVEASVKNAKKIILERARARDMPDAREVWDELCEVGDEHEWYSFARDHDFLEESVEGVKEEGWLLHLVRKHWPRVKDMIREDLA